MSESPKAVFLSYASQDVAAALRICAALRAAGIEVWFDQDALVGGDAWDQKIRRQIKDCTLFVPVISAATQARTEGYFRLEWRLADQRTHLMAKGRPFLLPVVIDATRDAEAHVPDSFTEVQWTRLPGGETPEAFCARVQKLLGGSEMEPGRPRPVQRDGGVASPASVQAKVGRRVPAAAWAGVAAVVALAVGGYFWLKRSTESAPISAPNAGAGTHSLRSGQAPSPPTVGKSPAPLSEARQLVARAWVQLNKPDVGRAELEVADDFCKRAAALDATDADVWAAWSQVDSLYLADENIDATPARRESARTKAARALQLSPESYEARLAHACYLVRGGDNLTFSLFPAEADALLRKLLQEQPEEPRALYALGMASRIAGKLDEAKTIFGRLAKQPAFAVLALSELGWTEYLYAGDYRAAELATDAAIARGPGANNLTLKLFLALHWRGDLSLANATLDRIPATVQQEDFGASMAAELHYWRRDAASMLRVVGGVSRDWLWTHASDSPKAWWSGLAHQLAGRSGAAQLQWRTALSVVERRLAEQPGSAELLRWKGRLQAATGDPKGAEIALRLADDTGAQRPDKWSWSVTDQILLGKLDTALTLLEQAAEQRSLGMSLANGQLNPSWDALREQPRFKALFARLAADPRMSPNATPSSSAASPPPALVSAKSVAVLAFANLSDDRSNEYFSDGISEELLNVLAKVPGLKVTARTSAFHFKGKDTPIPEIARQLGVAYVVEGSVRKQGDKVRITAQLIKAADGFHVWSDTFTRDLKDIFAVQDEIAGLIAQNLQLKLADAPRAARTVNPDAFNLYLEARQYVITISVGNLAKAEALFRRALEIDPEFTRAAAALVVMRATSTTSRCVASRHLGPELSDIESAARDLLRRDPALGEAHAALGLVLGSRDRGAEAETEFGKARDLGYNPEQWTHRTAFGHYQRGRPDLAIAAMEEARRMNPLAWTPIDVAGLGYLFTRRYAKAAEAFQTAAKMAGPPVTSANLALALIGLGRKDEALVAARQALAVPNRADWQPEFLAWSDGLAAWALAQAGVRSEAEAIVRRLLDGPVESRHAANYALTELGRVDEAAPTLEDMGAVPGYLFFLLNERPALLEDARFAPVLTKLRAEEDFAKFRRVVAEQADKK